MSLTIYLTKEEKKLFDGLSDALKAGVTPEAETKSFKDSPKHLAVRLEQVKLKGNSVVALTEKMKAATSESAMQELINNADLGDLDDSDLAQLLFAMGPELIGNLIEVYLKKADDVKIVESAAGLSTFRHMLLATQPSNA